MKKIFAILTLTLFASAIISSCAPPPIGPRIPHPRVPVPHIPVPRIPLPPMP